MWTVRCLRQVRSELLLKSLSTSASCKWLSCFSHRLLIQLPRVTNIMQLVRHCSRAEPVVGVAQNMSKEKTSRVPISESRIPISGSGLRKRGTPEVLPPLPARYNCSGCGAVLQSVNPKRRGFIPENKLKEWLSLVDDPSKESVIEEGNDSVHKTENKATEEEGNEEDDAYSSDIEDFFPEASDDSDAHASDGISSFICKRCFSLKNYNNALSITLAHDDYLRHLNTLKDKRALTVLILDVTDFPCCIFPDLKNLLSPKSSILILANKIDLFPAKLKNNFLLKFREYIIKECLSSGLSRSMIVGFRFVSAKKGIGINEVSQEIIKKWGNRGDVYLLGCTNVGKSSLFNKLLVLLCGSKPGELNTDSNILTPQATISLWPGTTLGLLSFPLMSIGKRRRLLAKQKDREERKSLGLLVANEDGDEFYDSSQMQDYNNKDQENAYDTEDFQPVEEEDILDKLDPHRKRKVPTVVQREAPQDRYWLHDTPGAINEAQLINHLTTKELTLGLPKKPLTPRTFVLKPGQCLFIGGLARVDYEEGPLSAYFTVFAWSYLNIHATKIINADAVYEKQLGFPNSIFKLPLEFESQGSTFPPLEDQKISVTGKGWKESAVDVILSSAGWVAVTLEAGNELSLRVHTPGGKGIYVREPLFPEAVNLRGKRERSGTRTAYRPREKR